MKWDLETFFYVFVGLQALAALAVLALKVYG